MPPCCPARGIDGLVMSAGSAHIVVIGNEKGGSGKTTAAVHLAVALARMGRRVAAIDLDVRQRSFSRHFENRANWCSRTTNELAMPVPLAFARSQAASLDDAATEDASRFAALLAENEKEFDFIVIDT